MGYLTIKENEFGTLKFVTPNEVIRKVYSDYFLEYIKRKAGMKEEIKSRMLGAVYVKSELEGGGEYADIQKQRN